MFEVHGITISLRAKNKLKTHSSFEKWDIEEVRTLKQVETTRNVTFYLSMQYKYPQIHFLCHRKGFFFDNFQENTTEYKSTDILVPRLFQDLRDCNTRAFKKLVHGSCRSNGDTYSLHP